MIPNKLTYTQHKIADLTDKFNHYKRTIQDLNEHCVSQYGITLDQLEEFTEGVQKDLSDLNARVE